MIPAGFLRDPLHSVFATELRTALNECANERQLRACADKLNSHQFELLPHDEQVELAGLYAHKHMKVTGALIG